MPDHAGAIAAARAIDALLRGWPIAIAKGNQKLVLSAVETRLPESDSAPYQSHQMLISAARAATLKIINQRAAARPDAPVMIETMAPLDNVAAMAIADPALDLANPLKGPFTALPLPDTVLAEAAMTLARQAGLLPAFVVETGAAVAPLASIKASDAEAYGDAGALRIAARARLPVAASETGEIVAFRSMANNEEHVALVVGERDSSPPVVRLHSECLTGDALGSLKCDCGPQLHAALEAMSDAQWGVLLYLRQEGRSIGLINKLRAYQLQDQGFDTVEANNRLGFATDARDFMIAVNMLKLLHIDKLRLMTNNPDKVARLEQGGITVVERLSLITPDNPYNRRYLDTKRDRTGHQL
ncbi:MAG: GTP cyclohydrolase II [Pseudomonadota bacterium]